MTKIILNNKEFNVDDSVLAPAKTSLQSHLSTTMAGSGATIEFGGVAYNIDSIKFSTARNDFVSHLSTIAGNGPKIVVNSVEYGVDSSKFSGTIAELERVFSELPSDSDDTLAAGLYQTGTDTMIASWDDLIADGKIIVDNGTISIGTVLPDDLPEKNEYGFYYGVPYSGDDGYSVAFYEDGSVKEYNGDELIGEYPSNSAIYSANNIYWSDWEWNLTVSSDGYYIADDEWPSCSLGSTAMFDGDLIMPNDGSITAIDVECFLRQVGLTNIIIPDSVTSIGDYAFGDCSGLTNIVIPDSVTSISDGMFDFCSELKSFTIPSSVTRIGVGAFSQCDSLTSIVIPDSVTSIGNYAFSNCDNLTSIVIGDSVTSIGMHAFRDCTSLASVVIPDSVMSIGDAAFMCCTSLTSIVIPDSVTSLGEAAFNECSSLEKCVIGNSVTNIGLRAFYGCSSLTSIVIPDSVTSIGEAVFYGCGGLTNIVIPDSVTSIGKSVFGSCGSLTSIEFRGTVAQWNAISKGLYWNYKVPATYVQCSDGQVTL